MSSRHEIVARVRGLLERQLDDRLVAAFVYGSVAAGTAGPGSDIDTFVITRTPLSSEAASQLGARHARLQAELGYQPDREHPVEVFSIRTCWAALRSASVSQALATVARGDVLDAATRDSDTLEIVRALLNPHLVVVESPVRDRLVQLAQTRIDQVASTHSVGQETVRARIGGDHSAHARAK